MNSSGARARAGFPGWFPGLVSREETRMVIDDRDEVWGLSFPINHHPSPITMPAVPLDPATTPRNQKPETVFSV
jgi:hypothetical protein